MTQQAQQVVAAFDALPAKEQREVAQVLLRRILDEAAPFSPEESLIEAAEALFLELDERETQLGQPETR